MNKIEQKLRSKFALRNIAEKSLLIPLNKSPQRLILLNALASYIWKNLEAGHSIAWCVRRISNQFKIQGEVVRSDIEKFFYQIKNGPTERANSQSLNRVLETKKIPFQGSFELTGRCNLNCFHCYAKGERYKKELPLQKVKKIIDELIENECLFLQLTGGECLVRKDFKKIYLYIRRGGIIPTISTNATLFTDELIQILSTYPPCQIKVSLYGAQDSTHDQITQTKGSFAKTLTNVVKLKKKEVNVWLSAVVFKENFSEIQKMKKLAQRINVPIFFYPFLIPTLNKDATPLAYCVDNEKCAKVFTLNKNLKFFKKPQRAKRKKGERFYPCNAGLQSFHIDSEGKLYLCKIERSIGFPLSGASFKDSWQKLAEVRLSKLRLPQICLDCKLRADCDICPPMIRLYESSGDDRIFCQRTKVKQAVNRFSREEV